MGELRDTYDEVQRIKEDHGWEPSREAMELLSRKLHDELGHEPSSAELKVTIDGLGWTGRMILDYGLDPEDVIAVPHDIARNTLANLGRADSLLTTDTAIRAGIGAGFFTGLYVGLMLERRRNGDET